MWSRFHISAEPTSAAQGCAASTACVDFGGPEHCCAAIPLQNNAISIWDVSRSAPEACTCTGHHTRVTCLKLSSDIPLLVSGGMNSGMLHFKVQCTSLSRTRLSWIANRCSSHFIRVLQSRLCSYCDCCARGCLHCSLFRLITTPFLNLLFEYLYVVQLKGSFLLSSPCTECSFVFDRGYLCLRAFVLIQATCSYVIMYNKQWCMSQMRVVLASFGAH